MLITAGRGGGIAGAANNEELGPVDTETLGDEPRQRLEGTVRSLNFFELPDGFPVSGQMSDPLYGWLRVEDGPRNRTVNWDDNHQPPEGLWEVVRALEETGATWHSGLLDS